MSDFIAALPMYDWPERRDEVDAEWAALRDRLRAAGVDAPEHLSREQGDIHDLWRSPNLLFAQACWGPMEQGLAEHVQVVGQPDYSGYEGGRGEDYSSAIVMRATDATHRPDAPATGRADIPVALLRGRCFTYNGPDSMSGILALQRDLEVLGEGLDMFSAQRQSGGHRLSIIAVADGAADIAAIDCRSWALAQRYEPAAKALAVVGWTARRKGLPFVTSRTTPAAAAETLKTILASP